MRRKRVEVPVGFCEDVASGAVTIMVVIAVVCSDVAGVAALFMTDIVGRCVDRALTVNMSMVAPTVRQYSFYLHLGMHGLPVRGVRNGKLRPLSL